MLTLPAKTPHYTLIAFLMIIIIIYNRTAKRYACQHLYSYFSVYLNTHEMSEQYCIIALHAGLVRFQKLTRLVIKLTHEVPCRYVICNGGRRTDRVFDSLRAAQRGRVASFSQVVRPSGPFRNESVGRVSILYNYYIACPQSSYCFLDFNTYCRHKIQMRLKLFYFEV